MCTINNDTAELIDEVIVKWTKRGQAFTSYEVTKEAQARLKEKGLPFVRHQDVRDYYDQSPALSDARHTYNYTRTLVPMPHGVPAFVYHPHGYDVADYQPLDRGNGTHLPAQVPASNLAGTTPTAATATATTPAPTNGQLVVNKIKLTASGNGNGHATRLPQGPDVAVVNKSGDVWISVPHVQQAGFQSGDIVDLSEAAGVVTIGSSATAVNGGVLRQKTVETKGNLRLSIADRTNLGLTSTSFKVDVQPGRLTLTSL